ncbi:hypothetical protein JTB14_010942 [Gonioctena quinquepunctata]|nr:hypothetical protein JTB14_010942 [Gonioctena quinquepunctata]
MFIVGLSNQAIKEKLLQEESLNLDKAIKIAKAIEITQLQARNLNKNTEVVVAKVGRSAHNSANWQKSKNSHLSNQVEEAHHKNNNEPVPRIHQHIHRILISPEFTFDFSSNIKVVRTTMYEPVLDRCVTTTLIKPSKLPIDEYSIYGYADKNDSPPPEKPPRRHSRAMKQASRHESNRDSGPPKMRTGNGDSCVDIDHMNIEHNLKNKKTDAAVQTSHLVPYRLRFLPGTNCDVKLSPSETNCALKLKCCCRIVSRWILSQVGLTVVVVIWALLGALAFFKTEGPRELQQSGTLAKIQKDLSIELATNLKQTEDLQDEWPSTIHKYFEKHEVLFLDAVGAGFGEGGGGNIWTYPGCILFAVSLLTTLGFGAPVPRTPLGRTAAVIFAAIGIPLHFLLIMNIGNLVAIKIQMLAYRDYLSEIPSKQKPKWLKWLPFLLMAFYYILGVVLFGFIRQRAAIDSFMFPLDFTAAGGVATVDGQTRIFYALYLEMAVTLAAIVLSLIQASASRGIVDVGLKLGLLTNT